MEQAIGLSTVATPVDVARLGTKPGRATHPWAWWGWAIGVAVAVSMTTNPLFLLLLGAAVVFVVLWRRTDAPWARALKTYLLLGAIILAIRLFFQVLFGSRVMGHVLFSLPEIPLPAWAAGIRLGGDVTLEAVLFTFYDSLRLALMLLCIGAANILANPKRALRNVPAALYELSVAVTIALTVAPQLIESTQRIRRARRLRGGAQTGWRAVRGVVIPVMEDAIDRSLALAAGMEVRGFGRTRSDVAHRRVASTLLLGGAMVATFGIFLLFAIPVGKLVLAALFTIALAAIVVGVRLSGTQLAVTHYRPDPWRTPEWTTLLAGFATAGCGIALGSTAPLLLTTHLEWPQLHPLMLLAAALTASPAFTTPVPPHRALQVRP